jgi:hypothetical protein
MTQAMVRRRSGDLRRHLDRWYYRNRPKLAVVAAFAVACLLGLVASAGLQSLVPHAAAMPSAVGSR